MSDADNAHIGYAQAADAYLQAGWKGVLAFERSSKWPPPSIKCPEGRRNRLHNKDACSECISYTGHTGIWPSYPDIAAWAEQHPDGGLGLRLPRDGEFGVVGVDVDDYEAKNGAATFAEAQRRWGRLPAGPRSTSRPGSASGIRLFRVPPGIQLRTLVEFPEMGLGDVEICQFHHRYVMAWPSIHPEGRPYLWLDDADGVLPIPRPESLPWLPQEWLDGLRVRPRSELPGDMSYNVTRTLTDGEPSVRVSERVRQAIKDLNIPGTSRHDTALRHVMALMRMGRSGEPGVRRSLQLLGDVFVAAVSADGSRSPDAARSEFLRMITNDNAARELSRPGMTDWFNALVVDVDPPVPGDGGEVDGPAPEGKTEPQLGGDETGPSEEGPSPDANNADHRTSHSSAPHSHLQDIERGFWDSRESLRMVYQTALARMAPPWGTLAHCAVRALTMIPPRVVLPPLIGGPGSLNFFAATVASASGGKGASAAAANVLIPKSGLMHRKIGSGEGLIAAYGKVGDDDSEPEHECIMFTTNEIDTFSALTTRSSSTLLPVLREGFFGEDLGFAYSAKDKRRMIPEHSYRMTLIISAQPSRMGWLLADADGGTPQRFMWFPASDSRIRRKDRPWEAGPLTLPRATEWLYPRTIVVPDETREVIETEHEKRSQGGGDAIDGHALFCREKFAYALAVMDGRIEMTLEDWELSGVAADISIYTRERAADAIKEAARLEAAERGELRGIELESADVAKLDEKIKRGQRVLKWLLHKLDAAGSAGVRQGELLERVTSRDREALRVILTNGHETVRAEVRDGAVIWRRA